MLQSILEKTHSLDDETLKKIINDADEGVVQSQLLLAGMYEMGCGVKKLDEEAFRFYKLAAEKGNLEACRKLFIFYLEGIGVNKSIDESNQYLEMLADLGEPILQHQLGINYANGLNGWEKSNKKAIKYWQLSADNGFPPSQLVLAECYQSGEFGVIKSPDQTFHYYKLASEPEAMGKEDLEELSKKFGESAKEHFISLVEDYKKDRKVGWALALFELGCCYNEGIGVEKSFEKSTKCFELSAEQGHVEAQLALAEYFDNITLSFDYLMSPENTKENDQYFLMKPFVIIEWQQIKGIAMVKISLAIATNVVVGDFQRI